MQSIEDRLITVVAEMLGLDEVNPKNFLIKDLGADSLDCIEILMEIEEEFDIEIPDEDAEKFKNTTIQEMIDYIKGRLD
jgi:acyl carrier protein